MFAISCSACQKKLSVQENLTGKKVKCPGCGHVTTVPAQTAPVGNEGTHNVPPASIPDGPTISPKPVEASDRPTNPSSSKPDATRDVTDESSHDSSLTDFLAPPQADDELGRLGQYRILKILGHGGMGVVFLGEDPKLGRKVAIKAMLPYLAQSKSSQQRFLREARAAATLEHDHIVAIHHVGEDHGAPYIVMPFLKGQPLDERLKSGAALPLDDILRIGREVACGLDAAHEAGLIHRDIKPANIWLEAPHARVKILDFGLARAAAQEAGLTQQGVIVGTPAYMAPEQGRGETVDHHCDLFSLGVVLYRLCTGKMPFHGNDTVSTLMAIATQEPTPPIQINAQLPRELSDLVMKLLEKKPADRTSSAAEVVRALQKMEAKLALVKIASVQTETMSAPTPTTAPGGERGQRGSARRKSPPLIAFALFAILFGAGGVYYWQTNNGTVRIEINDPDIKVAFDKNGPIITGVDQKDIKLTPGEFGLRIERGDLKFDTDKFILKRGETITLKIEWFKEGKLQVVQGDKVIGEKELPKPAVAVVPPGVGGKGNKENGAKETPKVDVAITPPPATTKGPADPDRKAAESLIPFADLVLKLKSGKRTPIQAGGKLPSEPFKVTEIGFSRYYHKDLPATFVGATLLPAIAELQSLTVIRNHFDHVETVTGEELAKLSKMPAAKTIKFLSLRFQLGATAFPTTKTAFLHGKNDVF